MEHPNRTPLPGRPPATMHTMKPSRVLRLVPSLILAVLTTAALAQGKLKPGLWEVQQRMAGGAQMDTAMAQMRERLASMPPDQRKMVEEMMAKQGVGMAPGGGSAIRVCISKEMAERGDMPTQQRGDCKTTITDRSASGMKMSFTCTNPQASGEGQFQFQGDSAYTMNMTVNSARGAQGRPETMTIQSQGRWVGADCGGLQPVPAR